MVIAAALVVATAAQVSSIHWTNVLLALAAVVSIAGAALWIMRQTREQRLRNERFDRDWYGESERPGVPARPGVMEQLLTLRTDVEGIKAEVNYNHGGSIKDVVDETREEVRKLSVDMKGVHERLDATTTTTTVTTVTAPDVH